MREYEKKRTAKRYQEMGYVIPSSADLFFYGYKEPLTKFEGGFGFKGVLSYSKEKDRVQCHFCGRLFRNVGIHAKFSHGFDQSEYKKKTGLLQNTALVGEGTRDKLILAHKDIKSWSQRGKSVKEIKDHMTSMSKKGSKQKAHSSWTLERRNKTGNCPEQIIEKIKNLQTKLGRRPRAKEYQREYGSYAPIITVYGKWENAIRLAGLPLYSDERAMKTDREFLLEHMRSFYKTHKRTPRTSDMRRGLLPAHQTYCKVFGTLNTARMAAHVPVLIPMGRYKWEEALLKTPPLMKI